MSRLVQTLVPTFAASCSSSSSISHATSSSSISLTLLLENRRKFYNGGEIGRKNGVCRAMVAVQGASATYAKEMERLSAKESLLLAIQRKIILFMKLSVEGPLRMKEYAEGVLETPTVDETTIPEQLKGGTFQRLFMISYLDEEILIIRDTAGYLKF